MRAFPRKRLRRAMRTYILAIKRLMEIDLESLAK